MNRQGTLHQQLEQVADLATLSPVSEDIIVSCIRERFMTDNIYTAVGSNALVAVNPHKYIASNSDAVLHKYATEYRDTNPDRTSLPPHIFQLANNAYYHMRRTAQDQSMLFTGETGSGKSENRRLAIKTLLELSVSQPGKKGAKLGQQVPAAEFVLEAFGNSRTLFNPNASHFGKYTELQFTERGRISGVKTLDYYLERNRVAGAPSGERNFHIFYYLIAGASPEERHHMHLSDKTQYRYLGARVGTAGRGGPGDNDDAVRFEQLKVALKNVGFSKRHVAQTCQLIAAILHLGNLEFTIDRHRNEDAAVVRNLDVLEIVAEFLGVQAGALEAALSYKTKLVKKELCTVFLDPDGASDNRDELAKTLYSLLFAWLNEHINQRLCRDDFATFIGLFDLPGPQNLTSRPNSLDQFCVNFANERLLNFCQKRLFEAHVTQYNNEGISRFVPQIAYFDNSECVRLLQNRPGGLMHIMDDQARRMPRKTDHTMVEAITKRWGNHSSFKSGGMDRSGFPTFTVSHYNGPVTYSAQGFLEKNLDALNPDFVSLLRGTSAGATDAPAADGSGSMNPFVRGLFSAKAIATQAHPRNEDTIVAAQQPVKPMRAPSTRRKNTIKRMPTLKEGGDPDEKKDDDDDTPSSGSAPCVAGEFRAALDVLFETLEDTQSWYVFCINPNDSQLPNQMEGRSVKAQVRSVGLSEIARRNVNVFEAMMTPDEFTDRYGGLLQSVGVGEGDSRTKVQNTLQALGLQERDIVLGLSMVFLSQAAFRRLEDDLRSKDSEEMKRNRMRDAEAEAGLDARNLGDPYAPYQVPGAESPYHNEFADPFNNNSSQQLPLVANASPFQRADMYEDYDERKSLRSEDFDGRSAYTSQRDDASVSNFGTESYAPSRNMFQNADQKGLLDKEAIAGEAQEGETTEVLKETSARRRWVMLCWILTWWVPNIALVHIGRMKRLDIRQAWREKLALNLIIWLVCGAAIFTNSPNNIYTSIRGEVFDLSSLVADHVRFVSVVPTKSILTYGGASSDKIFPVQVSALCNGVSGSVSPYVVLSSSNNTDENAQYHDFRSWTSDPRPDWYFETMTTIRWSYRVGFMGYSPKQIKSLASSGDSVAIYNGMVYDLSEYVQNPPSVANLGPGAVAPSGVDTNFMHSSIVSLFQHNAGTDITKQLDSLNIDSDVLKRQRVCLRNLFLLGKVDNRNSPQCLFATYILLALSIMMVSVIAFKFIASINFSAARAPEDHDKFVICQVPCYTEGTSSIKKTIDSLAQMKYDDKRKLLFIICDGMVVGSGNDMPTPRIVLDVLGANPNVDAEPLSFLSLGEGAKQHNMGKVFSGLYETAGHVVPYVVVVKCGKPGEKSRPGNRGKRDSQMILMNFLNKVHFNAPMNPLELEMYHQIKNVIGVNPTFYEYCLMVDADTTVAPLSLNQVLGCCGETELANAKQSLITMMQVYEYFISHHMAKSFESLSAPSPPLFISNQIIQDYSENRVDTLHMKNLLHLGEDRYLTTLLLKHFSNYKTQFVRDAHAYTVAPDDWKVLLSQRRRWINSTVHNLGELVFLDQLCGFCCFSMRFVVMIDLLSTIIQPVTVAYIGYLIYLAANHATIPTLSIILIAAVYGLQALVFVLRRKWDMIGWMVFYILAIPVFSLALPLYSFWRMDDFSWGQTRIVLGESGKKVVVHDEGKFDPRSIPLKSWNDYENELWDKESNHSIGSWVPPGKMHINEYPESHTASIYGRETMYEPAMSRAYSPAPSQMQMGQMGMMYPPPGYHSGRNTPLSQVMTPGVLHQPAPSRPTTNYLDVQIPGSRSPEDQHLIGSGPTDAEIEGAVDDHLRHADLTTVTKREIRRRLEEQFGQDLSSRKRVINDAIDRVLLSRAG
ncbi:glycosyltransferase family 2 protein [Epithele typhae]|uniref:glycosyltransferase family 2 protein n=1 Tax=Epithele typhae TaxID=378194 RepID=UPI002007C573|nr:glycosyltransferase family 2 protein [Epithele typhae]KAH9911828.1 glycosyltransferase family 2 protein [Epithele typhae]